MRGGSAFWVIVMLLASLSASEAATRIAGDRGGRIGTYLDKFQDLRRSGDRVMIDGLCASACTLVLGVIAEDKICVTPRAKLGFHAAWDANARGRPVTNREATRLLFSMYPDPVKRWITRRGGLKRHMIFLSGPQLARMYRPCHLDAEARLR
jgi:hypothetical protein